MPKKQQAFLSILNTTERATQTGWQLRSPTPQRPVHKVRFEFVFDFAQPSRLRTPTRVASPLPTLDFHLLEASSSSSAAKQLRPSVPISRQRVYALNIAQRLTRSWTHGKGHLCGDRGAHPKAAPGKRLATDRPCRAFMRP